VQRQTTKRYFSDVECEKSEQTSCKQKKDHNFKNREENKMNKKLSTILVTVMLAGALLTACGGG
jgi:hypothetical protein